MTALLFALVLTGAATRAADGILPGEFRVEPATLICLGFEWDISGDDNRNAAVEAAWRREGAQDWNQAMPLLRIGGERIRRANVGLDYTTTHMFAGSIIDLEPDTSYECRFTMSDPDGVQGEALRTVVVHTRAEPKPFEGGRVFHVYPPGYTGQKLEPAFTGLQDAYYGPGGGDWSVFSAARVEPGDTILLHAGVYKANRFSYTDPYHLEFHGSYVLTQDGTPDRPITIRAAGDGEVVLDGDGCHRLFDVSAADCHIFDGLTIRNSDIAFFAGMKNVIGCSGLVVRNCRIEDVGIGITAQNADSKDFYIADNTLIGRADPGRLHGWTGMWAKQPEFGGVSDIRSYYGIKVYGRGHVICHNYVARFHDGICVCTHGVPEPQPERKCVAIDIYNNDIFLTHDDFIEADGGVHNIRVLRNRGFNSGQCGLSAQPVYGGPAYFIRNIVYNVPPGSAFKFFVDSAGLYVYHNTIISEWIGGRYSNAHVANNLFLGRDWPDRPILSAATYTDYTTFDYNGYRPNRSGGPQFVWEGPPMGKATAYEGGRVTSKFETLDDFRKGTRREAHGILVDYDIFVKAAKPDSKDPTVVYEPANYDFSLHEDCAAIDAGKPIPNVNDEFAGNAPDLGAYEVGAPLPHYGPRKAKE